MITIFCYTDWSKVKNFASTSDLKAFENLDKEKDNTRKNRRLLAYSIMLCDTDEIEHLIKVYDEN